MCIIKELEGFSIKNVESNLPQLIGELEENIMRKVPVYALRPGMKLGRSIFTSDGIMLLRSGMLLTKKSINRLKLMEIPCVYIDDGFDNDVEVSDVVTDEVRSTAIKRVRSIFNNAKVSKKGCSISYVLNESNIRDIVENILENILSRNDVVVSLTDIRSFDDYTYGHSVNVCVLSLITGNALGLSQKSLTQLGIGAILHDIGKVLTPKEILNKPGNLTEEEFEIIKRHTEEGYNLVRAKKNISNLAASVIYEHHERVNGTGYPRGIRAEEIHLYSKIVGLVDVYDALTADRIYRKGYMPHQAYEMLAGTGNSQFDFEVLSAFLKNIAMYPVGVFVELNSGQVGTVIKTIKGLTHRPVIRVYFEEKNIPVSKPYEVDLSEELNLMITRVLDFEEVDKLSIKVKKFLKG